jgi:2',3'-cyclic-nucleotide 2'-phosphodiesterase (5'-nucleotidase family)
MSNYKFKTTNIRGKKYVEVNERIKFLRQEERLRDWTIATDFPMLDSESCVCKCTIADIDGRVVSTGHAHEERGSSNINKTSYVENCETSAVGRALAMLGIGIDASIASANEVEEAIAKQQELVDNPQVQKLSKKLDAPVENIMDKAVGYIKSQTDKKKAFTAITKKYGDQLSEKQVAGLQKFVR